MKFIFSSYFEYKLIILDRDNYKKTKQQYKNHLILEDKKIIRDKNKVLAQDKIKIETSIVEKFLAEGEHKTSLII